jgi:hypothetical protein
MKVKAPVGKGAPLRMSGKLGDYDTKSGAAEPG